jgi:hypothetical protein
MENMNTQMPFVQQILLDLVAPPILTCIWWLFSRGWAGAVQGGKISDRTKSRQRIRFWIVLAIIYVAMFGTTIYYRLRP